MKKGKVLVIEDEEGIREVVSEALHLYGHEVAVCPSGSAALKRLREERFDLVITDLVLPGCDGFEVLKYINEHGINTPVIVLSGYLAGDAKEKALSLGATQYLQKPVSVKELIDIVRRFV